MLPATFALVFLVEARPHSKVHLGFHKALALGCLHKAERHEFTSDGVWTSREESVQPSVLGEEGLKD